MKHHTRTYLRALAALTVLAPSAYTVRAANNTWSGTTDANLATATNWSLSPTLTDNTWVFGAAGSSGTTLNNDLTANLNVAGITFNTGAAYILGGNAINLGGNITLNSGAANQEINLNMAVTGTRTISTDGNSLTLNGVISGSPDVNFTASNGGLITLTQANSYTGNTRINGSGGSGVGAVSIDAFNRLGTGTTINLGLSSTAGTLRYTGSGETTGKVINLNAGTSNATLDQSGTGLLQFTSNLTATGAGSKTLILQGSTAGTGEIAGAIVDNSATNKTSVSKSGTGTWTLSGANTYSGTTTVSAGTLVLNGTNTSAGATTLSGGTLSLGNASNGGLASGLFSLNGGSLQSSDATARSLNNALALGGSVTFGGTGDLAFTDTTTGVALSTTRTLTVNNTSTSFAQAFSGTGSLTKAGTGTLTLSGASTNSGTTTVSAGVLELKNTGSGFTQALGGLNLAGADVTLKSNNAGSGNLSTTFSSLTSRASGNTANITSAGGTNGTSNNLIITGKTALALIDRGIFFNGSDYASTDSAGFVRAFNYSTDTSAVSFALNSGTQASASYSSGAGNNTVLTGSTGDITAQTGRSANTLKISGTHSITMAAGNTLTFNGLLKTGGGLTSFNAGTITSSNTNNEIVIRVDGSSDALTINSLVAEKSGQTTPLTKSGAGTLTLSGVNTYLGATKVNAGTLFINGNQSAATGAVTVAAGATLGGNGKIGGATTINSGGFLTAGATTSSIGTLTFSGGLTGTTGSTFSFKFNSGNLTSDLFAVTGTAALGSSTLSLTDLGSATLTNGETFTLLTASTSVSGTFLNLTNGAAIRIGSTDYTLNYLANSVTLTASAIPEPATFAALAGLGILGFAVYRRRQES